MAIVKPKKDFWDKVQIGATFLIPITIAFFGSSIQSSLKNEDVKLAYISVAIDILRETPKKETTQLRLWAVDILSEFSLVDLSDEALEELRDVGLPTDRYLRDHTGSKILDSKGNPIKVMSK